MRKIEKRSIFCLILAALLGLGLAFFCFRFVVDGGDWASYPYNRHLYNNAGQLKGGTILDLFRQSIAAIELENVTALQGARRQMRTLLPHGSMDYVICNPPYFDRNAGANAPTAEKRTARQDATCSVEELAVAASFVLHTGGKAAFVFRPERLWVLLEALSRVRLVPKRMRFVHQSVQAAPSVVMVECRKGGSAEGLVVEPPLIVESDEYFRIYGIEH